MNDSVQDPVAALYAVRVGVGLCSSLSILGACAIVLSYAAFPELRTTARQMLLNLSLTDIILSLAYLMGLIQNANTLENPYSTNGSVPYWLCEAQAFGIIFASDAAILWTISIGMYFFVTIALQRPKHARRLLPVFYICGWGIAVSVVLWLLLTDSLGYEPGSDPAFCGILSTVIMNGKRVDADYPFIAGYEAWNYLAFAVLPILFISTLCQNRRIKKLEKKSKERELSTLVSAEEISNSTSSTSSSATHFKHRINLSQMSDRRVVVVPVVYMLLKFWGIAVDVGIYFLSTHAKTNYRQNVPSSILVFISGVGSALPGFVHGVLFCALTKEVRQTMTKGIWSGITNCEVCIYDHNCGISSCCKCRKRRRTESTVLISEQYHSTSASPVSNQEMLDNLSEYDIVPSPDPTSSVSITELPRFAHHFPDDDSENGELETP